MLVEDKGPDVLGKVSDVIAPPNSAATLNAFSDCFEPS
jgi:hypothetical protein